MISGKRELVDLEQPELGVVRGEQRRVTPEARFAPEWFHASRRVGERIELAIAVVVVLPFVAETSATPSGSRLGEGIERTSIELPDELAGQGRPAAAARSAGQSADEPGR